MLTDDLCVFLGEIHIQITGPFLKLSCCFIILIYLYVFLTHVPYLIYDLQICSAILWVIFLLPWWCPFKNKYFTFDVWSIFSFAIHAFVPYLRVLCQIHGLGDLPHIFRMKKSNNDKCWQRHGETGILRFWQWGFIVEQSLWETVR